MSGISNSRRNIQPLIAEIRTNFSAPVNLNAFIMLIKPVFGYFLFLWLSLSGFSVLVSFVASFLCGIFISMLFMIAHDAAHGCYTTNKTVNRLIAYLGFFFTAHNYKLWVLYHNKHHHGFQNVKGMDIFWSPTSLNEYLAMSPWRKRLEKLYRSWAGVGFYYLIAVWPRYMILPYFSEHTSHDARRYINDAAFALLAAPLQVIAVLIFAGIINSPLSVGAVVLWGSLFPFLVWNGYMGFTSYMQHTHPTIGWFKKKEPASQYETALYLTAQSNFRQPLQDMYLNMMEHQAHHLVPSVPLYKLADAQRILEKRIEKPILKLKDGFESFLMSTSVCKLYDFDRKCWTDFEGRPTSLEHTTAEHEYPQDKHAAA